MSWGHTTPYHHSQPSLTLMMMMMDDSCSHPLMVFITLYSLSHNQVYTRLDGGQVRQNHNDPRANQKPTNPKAPSMQPSSQYWSPPFSRSEIQAYQKQGSGAGVGVLASRKVVSSLKVALLVNVLMLGLAFIIKDK